MKQDPPLDAKCRDKFLVQCAPIPSDKDFSTIASVLESADKATLAERKIRVNWLAANSEDAQGLAAPAVSTPSKPSAVNGVRLLTHALGVLHLRILANCAYLRRLKLLMLLGHSPHPAATSTQHPSPLHLHMPPTMLPKRPTTSPSAPSLLYRTPPRLFPRRRKCRTRSLRANLPRQRRSY